MGMNLNFDNGVKVIYVNGDKGRKIMFNPTDSNFIYRLHEFSEYMLNELPDIAREVSDKLKESDEVIAELKYFNDIGDDACAKLDYVFGKGTSEAAFQGINPMSINEEGVTYFQAFAEILINAITPEIEKMSEKISKADNKYVHEHRERVEQANKESR